MGTYEDRYKMNLEQLNWELCEAYLKDSEDALKECREHLSSLQERLEELKRDIDEQEVRD